MPDSVNRTATPSCSEFRTLLLIKEHLETGVCIRWVPSGAQIAGGLTKVIENTVLREILRIGQYTIRDEAEPLRQRADTRTCIKWLPSNVAADSEHGKAKSSILEDQELDTKL